MPTTMQDQFDTRERENLQTIQRWVQAASGQFLTINPEPERGGLMGNVSVRRTDGKPMNGPKAGPVRIPTAAHAPVIGVMCRIDVSRVRKLDRRYRSVHRQVRDAVRTVLVDYVADEDTPGAAYMALADYERRNGLR